MVLVPVPRRAVRQDGTIETIIEYLPHIWVQHDGIHSMVLIPYCDVPARSNPVMVSHPREESLRSSTVLDLFVGESISANSIQLEFETRSTRPNSPKHP
jgi:hypothetical protein